MSAKIKISIFITLIFILISSTVNAANFLALIEPIKNNIYTYEQAKFKLHVTNNQDIEDIITIRSNSLNWDLQSNPLYHYFSGIKLKPNETISTELILIPTESIGIGRYIGGLILESQNKGTKLTKQITINVKAYHQDPQEYNPSVEIDTTIPEKIDPRKTEQIKINLKNSNALNISKLSIEIKSNLINFYRETNLPPLLEKTEYFDINLNPSQIPYNDELTITIKRNDEILRVIQQNFEVTSYSQIKQEYNEEKHFLKKIKNINVTNIANIPTEYTLEIPKNKFELFTSTNPKAKEISKLDGKFYTWDLTLSPSETNTVEISRSNRPLLVIGIIVLMLIGMYFIMRNEITVKKVGTTIAMKEGGKSEIKILIFVKNRSSKFVQNLNIVDRIPRLAEVTNEQTMGTLAPNKILRHEKKGTLIKWNVEALESQEERILSYKIVTKLSILGNFQLPPTVVKYQTEKGNERIASSDISKA